MSKIFYNTLLMAAIFTFSFAVHAQIPVEFTKLFEAQQYQEAIDLLKKVDDKILPPNKKSHLLGVCFSRQRKYELAILEFKKAVKEDDPAPDLFYEYGQALFAINDLRQARYQFTKSSAKNFNYTASTYYVAYISELLDDVLMAKYNYGKLIKDKRTDKKFLQISLFQYAKILLKMMRREEESMKTIERNLVRLEINLITYIPKYIMPLLVKARDLDLTTEVSGEVEQLMRELLAEFKLDPNILINGRRISAYRLYASIAQRLKYDDNVALTNNASTIYETETFAKYDFIFKKRFVMAPELRLSYNKYKDQKKPEVYQNDSFTFNSAIRSKLEHTSNGQPASFLFDLEYGSLYKDWKREHQRKFFSKSYTIGIGEQLTLFNSGETFFRVRHSDYTDKTENANYKTLSISAEQYIFLKEGQHLMITTLDMSKLQYYPYEELSYNTYMARFIYLAFEIIPTYTLQWILAATLTDTLKQKELKGYELTLNPSIDISKAFTNKLRFSVNYNFISNKSKSAESKYQRQIVGTELSYSF